MNNNPLERDIEKRVCDYAKTKGVLCYKFTSPSKRSVPDRIFITPAGAVFFIEFKRLHQKPTPAQAVEIEKIRSKGVSVFVVDDVAAGKKVVEGMLEKFDSLSVSPAEEALLCICRETTNTGKLSIEAMKLMQKALTPVLSKAHKSLEDY